jgi:hypothetical protein
MTSLVHALRLRLYVRQHQLASGSCAGCSVFNTCMHVDAKFFAAAAAGEVDKRNTFNGSSIKACM